MLYAVPLKYAAIMEGMILVIIVVNKKLTKDHVEGSFEMSTAYTNVDH